ncbi:hypothetical protein E3N88_12587 [Mikania micrantha]|uniref:Uncharacterized protein n=1 Tax=Mikania micrantha TaxID=192012 RepID=A0A5N6P794_9ASTR|nr:hypothetical protein E3N88_12587 [Mikania micrantha]
MQKPFHEPATRPSRATLVTRRTACALNFDRFDSQNCSQECTGDSSYGAFGYGQTQGTFRIRFAAPTRVHEQPHVTQATGHSTGMQQVGPRTYNNVFRVSKLQTGRIVALKKGLWYSPSKLLLGSTKYEASVDLWSIDRLFAKRLLGSQNTGHPISQIQSMSATFTSTSQFAVSSPFTGGWTGA